MKHSEYEQSCTSLQEQVSKEVHGNHVVFTINDSRDDSWSLFVIDDNWYDAVISYEEIVFAKKSYREIVDVYEKQGSELATNKVPIALLPLVAPNLHLARLILVDFPRGSDEQQTTWLEAEVKRLAGFGTTAFLIDINDARTKKALGLQIVPKLLRLGVPKSHMAFFTIGHFTGFVDSDHSELRLEKILKDAFLRTGRDRLCGWLERVEGRIDKAYFNHNCVYEYTRYIRGKIPHFPSALSELSTEDIKRLAEDEILADIARRDKYGVWSWVRKTMREIQSESLDEVQYNYLCGKTFLARGTQNYTSFTALRGLVWGLGELFGISIETYPLTIPDNKDDTHYQGDYQFSSEITFEEFAKSLRGIVESLQREEGHVKIERMSLARVGSCVEIRLRLSGHLPGKITEDKGTGLATKSYRNLKACFSHEAFSVKDDNKKIEMTLRAMDEPT